MLSGAFFQTRRIFLILKRSYLLGLAFLLLSTFCLACTPQDITGTYIASVPFHGVDPRFTGQDYQWQLALENDGSFSITFELPLAVYTVDGRELTGKAKGEIRGQWKQSGSRVILTRDSGDASLGSLDTMSFSMQDDRLIIQMQDGEAFIIQGSNRLILVKIITNR